MEKSTTIANACNLYWRMHRLPASLIAVESLQGWRGAQVNQSLKPLQWLYYQENVSCIDQINHVRNGGEQTIVTTADSHFVDRSNPQTCTVYKFHGCLWHGCKKCYACSRTSLKHTTHKRTSEEKYQATVAKTTELLLESLTSTSPCKYVLKIPTIKTQSRICLLKYQSDARK